MAGAIHYLVGNADDGSEGVEHVWADSQEEAVEQYVKGENQYGNDAEHYDGYEIMVVPLSKVDSWSVEIVQPVELEVKLTKAVNPSS
jgi:hypothetical protein